MASALQYAEVDAPGADGFVILVRHDAGELMEVGEVVDGPGGEQLRERHGAEGGMASAAGEIAGLEIEFLEGGEAFFAEGGEVFEELLERFGLRLSHLGKTIEGGEWLCVAVLEDMSHARYPVVALGQDHVAHDVVGTPGVFSFVATNPAVGQSAQERIEGCWRTSEQRDGVGHGMDEYKRRVGGDRQAGQCKTGSLKCRSAHPVTPRKS